jgi:hypothetical protein
LNLDELSDEDDAIKQGCADQIKTGIFSARVMASSA